MNRQSLQPQLPVDDRDDAWYAFNSPYQRLRLFSSSNIAGIGLAVCIGLTLGFPYKSLEERLTSSERHRKADRLTAEYLKVFLEAEPTSHGLRVQLVRQLIQLGAFPEARAALQPLAALTDAGWQKEAAWLELGMIEQEAYAEPADSPRRAELVAQLRKQLQLLLQYPQEPERLKELADKALASQDARLAGDALRGLADSQGRMNAASFAAAARAALGLQEYVTSADLYFRAMLSASRDAERRRYYIDGLRTLQSGGRYREAIAAADRYLEQIGDDRATLLFLARLAQSANLPEAAERYALRLLKLSIQMQLGQPVIIRAAWGADTPAAVMRVAAVTPGAGPALPFDEEAYLLGFNIFVSNRNLEDARRVAASAVRQQPDSAAWRKRLAEVCEWTNSPQDALPQWLAYARMTGEETAWNNVVRLAESLGDSTGIELAMRHKMQTQPGNRVWLDRLLASYENSGEPDRGVQLLKERLFSGVQLPPTERRRELILLAELCERMGRDADALDTWKKVQREFGVDADTALRLAALIGMRGRTQEEAYRTLVSAAASAPPEASEFWRALAELARLRQDDEQAAKAYRELVATDAEEESDLFNLVALLEAQQPLAGARAAMYGFRKTRNLRFALSAVNASIRAADHRGALAFLRSLEPNEIDRLRQDPQFLSARAGLLQSTGDIAGAERDLQAALILRPQDGQYRAFLVWVLIARRDTVKLQRALSSWAADAEDDPDLWGPYAAAHMALNRQRDALHWFRKPGFLRDDYLWLMSYAEALDATSQPDLAWQIRRYVWINLRKPEVLKQANPERLKELRDRLVALAPLFASGDAAAALLQALLRADLRILADLPPPRVPSNGRELLAELEQAVKAAPVSAPLDNPTMSSLLAPGGGQRPRDDARMSAAVRELALSFALNQEAHDLARAWLVTRFAEQLSRPLWGELSLLLAAEDRAGLSRLLDDLPDWLPMYDRIEAAQRAGRHGLAQTLAFEQLDYLQHDEELHARFTSMATSRPPGFAAGIKSLHQSPLVGTELNTEASVPLTTGLRLTLATKLTRQESRNVTQLRNVPESDRSTGITLRMDVPRGILTASVHQRSGVQPTNGLRMTYAVSVGDGVEFASEFGWHQMAPESALLRAAATRSGATGTMTWAFSKNEFLRIGLGWHRFDTQGGTTLGSGLTWNAEAGTHLRIEYPNLILRASASGGNYSTSGRFDQQIMRLLPSGADPQIYPFLPQDSTLFGISLGVGTTVDGRYSRAWRPFAELGLTYGRQSGRGLNWGGGIAGSALGQDSLQIKLSRNGGTPTAPEGFTEFGIQYFWLY